VSLFDLTLRPGVSIFDQIVFAAVRAFLSGEYQKGQPFPSVRALAAEFKIHPNTAQKVIQHLIKERFLEARPGVGTVVAPLPAARAGDRRRLLKEEVGQLVVEALRVGATLPEVLKAIEDTWAEITPSVEEEEQVDTRR
jgi:DNA-binding transcriptional regulator YhcF (GntR family)